MGEAQRAFVACMLALAGWRAAKDVESYVAHLVRAGDATAADLSEARARTAAAHRDHRRAMQTYNRQSTGSVGSKTRRGTRHV